MSISQNKHPKKSKSCETCQVEFLGTSRARFCLSCRKVRHYKQNADYYKSHQEHMNDINAQWRKDHPGKQHEFAKRWHKKKRKNDPGYFESLKDKGKKYYRDNRERLLEQKIIYHIKHRDHINRRSKFWRAANPHKVAALNMKLRTRDPINPELIKLVFKLYNYECMYCGYNKTLSLEHILPISRGGDNSFENLGVACKSCNSSKRNKTPVEFMEYRHLALTF